MTPPRTIEADGAQAYDRRAGQRPTNGRGFWLRRVQPTELLALVALAIALLGAFGYRRYNPEPVIAALDVRLTKDERRADSLAAPLTILLRLQCLNKAFSDRDRQLVGLDCAKVASP